MKMWGRVFNGFPAQKRWPHALWLEKQSTFWMGICTRHAFGVRSKSCDPSPNAHIHPASARKTSRGIAEGHAIIRESWKWSRWNVCLLKGEAEELWGFFRFCLSALTCCILNTFTRSLICVKCYKMPIMLTCLLCFFSLQKTDKWKLHYTRRNWFLPWQISPL